MTTDMTSLHWWMVVVVFPAIGVVKWAFEQGKSAASITITSQAGQIKSLQTDNQVLRDGMSLHNQQIALLMSRQDALEAYVGKLREQLIRAGIEPVALSAMPPIPTQAEANAAQDHNNAAQH